MIETVNKVVIYIISLGLALYATKSIQYEKIIPIHKTTEIWLLNILLSIVISYLVSSWWISILALTF